VSTSSPDEFLMLMMAAADGEDPRIVQLCITDHSDQAEPHLHVQVHMVDKTSTVSRSEWLRLDDMDLEDLRLATERLKGSVRIHMHGPVARKAASRCLVDRLESTAHCLSEAEAEVLQKEGRGTCPICLVELAAGDELIIMPCDGAHAAHWSCMRPWLARASTCPACRFALPAAGESEDAHAPLVRRSLEAVDNLRKMGVVDSLAHAVSARRIERAQARSASRTPPKPRPRPSAAHAWP